MAIFINRLTGNGTSRRSRSGGTSGSGNLECLDFLDLDKEPLLALDLGMAFWFRPTQHSAREAFGVKGSLAVGVLDQLFLGRCRDYVERD